MRNKIDDKISINAYINRYLKRINVEYEINDIYVIISFTLSIDINSLRLNKNNIYINDYEVCNLNENLNLFYIDKVPLQYITKRQYFFNEEYIVSPDVLIPRQDTEILVEKSIEYIQKYKFKKMIDMCTGSGCIGISCAKNSNIENVVLVDISRAALDVANSNVKKNKVEQQCRVVQSNLFENLYKENLKYDIIVSNPPYIRSSDMKMLSEYVKKEPMIALDGGEDGMNFYNNILYWSRDFLIDSGIVIFEIGYDELKDIKELIKKYEEYELIEAIKDYGGNDRVVVCRFRQI